MGHVGWGSRNEDYLKETVITIYNAIKNLGDYVNRLYRESTSKERTRIGEECKSQSKQFK
jgi:asparagine synthetase A